MPTNGMNPMQLIQMIQSSQNPQQFAMNMIKERMGQNPMFNNLFALAEQNKTAEIEAVARNMCREKGMDFDKEFNNFKNMLGL